MASIKEIASEASAARAFEYAGNFGRGTFTFRVGVSGTDDAISLTVVANARVSEKQATSELIAVVAAIRSVMPCAKRSKKITRMGFYHGSQFVTEGFAVTMQAA